MKKIIILILGMMMLLMIASVSACPTLNSTCTPCSGGYDGTSLYQAYFNSNSYGDLTGWDVSCITDFSEMFRYSTTFNQDISGWNTSSAIDMSGMFLQAYAFNQDISGWDVSSVTNMNEMFRLSAFTQDIGGWDTSSVTDMGGMFQDTDFNQDISEWDVSSVIIMQDMFDDAHVFNQDIGGWDTSSVTNMDSLFYNAYAFTQDISEWDVSSVTTFQSMFRNIDNFNQDIGGWDTSSATDMINMFLDNGGFNQDLTGWNVTLIPTEASGFGIRSVLDLANYPVWGTDGCSPDWSCSNWVCVEPDAFESCDAVTDNNACGGSYTGDYSEFTGNACVYNTAPVLNSISPASGVELQLGDTQIYTADVTDTEDDASYNWTIDGRVVSLSETFSADYDDIEAGFHTLELVIDDGEFSDSDSVEFEVRGVGGSSSGVSVQRTTSEYRDAEDVIVTIDESGETNVATHQNWWQRFIEWISRTMSRIRGN